MSDSDHETQVEPGPQPGDPDVEGHILGAMNPTTARELARTREQDIDREMARRRGRDTSDGASRGSLLDGIRRMGRRSR